MKRIRLVIVGIVRAAHFLIRLARFCFSALENRTVQISNFEPDWSVPTYNILRLLIIAFAAIIYPYIPDPSRHPSKVFRFS
jgi:hypothetical protein